MKKLKRKLIFFILFIFLFSSIFAESFRVKKLIPVTLSDTSTEEQKIVCGINDSVALFLPEEKNYIEGIEIKMTIPSAIAEWTDCVACSIYDFIEPIPKTEQIDYSGKKIFLKPLPSKLSWILQIPLSKENSIKNSQYTTKIDEFPSFTNNFTFLRFQPAMKGIPDETYNSKLKLEIKPILKNIGKLDLNITTYDNQNNLYTVYIDDVPTEINNKNVFLSTGMHKLNIITDNYRNEVQTIIIEQAKTTSLKIQLKSLEPTLFVEAPENAEFYLDEKQYSANEEEIIITEGEHKLRFILGDYEIIRMINAKKGKSYTANLKIDLQILEE